MSFKSLKEIVDCANKEKKPFWRVILEEDMSERMVSEEESFGTMQGMYDTMRMADASYDEKLKSASGLVGGDGKKMKEAVEAGKTMAGDFIGDVMVKALKMGESNACMKRIVAAPTAGSCGVMPAVFLTYQEKYKVPDEKMIEAMFVAAGIGEVIAERAFIAGATGGCQAEIGSASAMAAGRRSEPTEDTYFAEVKDNRDGPEAAYLQEESKEYVFTICQSLKSPYKEVATEHFYREKSAKEIAEETGKGIKTVQTQIYRAKAMIKKLIEGRATRR